MDNCQFAPAIRCQIFSALIFCALAFTPQMVGANNPAEKKMEDARQQALNRMFSREANLSRPGYNAFNKSATPSKRDAFPVKSAQQPRRAGGWDKSSDMATRTPGQGLSGCTATLPKSRFAGANRTANLGNTRFLVPSDSPIASSAAQGFSNTVEAPQYRGRLPHEAVQALDDIKKRELSIDEVRDLLNKHRKPE